MIFRTVIILILINNTLVNGQTITVVTEESPPCNYKENNKIIGSSTEIIKEILHRAHIDYSLELYTWARTYKTALENKNVLIYSIARTEKREPDFKWVGIIYPYKAYLYKLTKRKDIVINSLKDAMNYTIGVVVGDVREDFFIQNDFKPKIHLESVIEDNLNILKLSKNRIDLVPLEEIGGLHRIKKLNLNPIDFTKVLELKDFINKLYCAFSISTPDTIVEVCKKKLEEIKSDGTYCKILDKYMKFEEPVKDTVLLQNE